MKKLRYFLLLIVVLNSFHLFAIDLYIATTGNDTNQGTKNQPLATLKGARDAIRKLRSKGALNEGITVIIEKGTYFMNEPLILTAEDAAPSVSPVVFMAAPGEKVEFIGGIEITNLVKVNDKLWKTSVAQVARYGCQFEQLFVNEKRAVRARTPNVGQLFYVKSAEQITIKQGVPDQPAYFTVAKIIADSTDVASLTNIRPEDLQNANLTIYHYWVTTRKVIEAFDPTTNTFFTVGKEMIHWPKVQGELRYFIENYKEDLDAPGEWFLEKDGTLYYIPRKDERIEDIKMIAPVLDKFIVIQGDGAAGKYVENISFRNIAFKVAGYKMPRQGDAAVQAAAPTEAVIMADFAKNIEFYNCEIAHTGLGAIWFRQSCSDSKIIHCYLHDLGAGGIKIGPVLKVGTSYYSPLKDSTAISKNIIVDNNIIRSGGWVFPSAVGVTIFNASDNKITHNEIADFRYSGISAGWVWTYATSYSKRNIITYNHIHHLGWGELSDMGGVYTIGKSEGTIVSNNNIHHIYSHAYNGAWGLYYDEGATGIIFENNLVYACKTGGFMSHFGKDNITRNNIFAFNLKSQIQATSDSRLEEHHSFQFTNNIIYFNSGSLLGVGGGGWVGDRINFKSDSNCYWDERTKDVQFGKFTLKEWQQKSGKDTHSIIADPDFINSKELDFKLKNKAIAKRIDFKPFDFNKAGVYGSQKWIELAQFDAELAKKFDEVVERNEALDRKKGAE